ncbi:hypothetical protein PAMP_015978 [Pampus punctatissimus]
MAYLLLLLLLVCSSQASHFFGTVMTYYPKTTDDRSLMVVLRYRLNLHSCTTLLWSCLSNCGQQSLFQSKVVMQTNELCQTETISHRLVHNNAPFQLTLEGSTWISNIKNNILKWRAVTLVELRKRSDTGQSNTSPQTTILLAVSPTSSSDEGLYAVQLVMEDFPRQTITLTQTDGLQEVKTTNDAISKIPIQFVLTVDPAVPSCTEGLYLPEFLPPTPANRAQLYSHVNQVLEISIYANASNSTVSELLFSGPHSLVKTTLGTGQFILRWTPSKSEIGESHSICFVVQAMLNSDKYHSDMRCVLVTVEDELTTTTTTTSTTTTTISSTTTTTQTTTTTTIKTSTTQSSTSLLEVTTPVDTTSPTAATLDETVRMRISSSSTLSEDDIKYTVIKKIKDELMKRGLPSDISLHLRRRVVLRYKLNFHSCTDLRWMCQSGNCGNDIVLLRTVDMESSGEWCQNEGISTRQVPSNAPFQLCLVLCHSAPPVAVMKVRMRCSW